MLKKVAVIIPALMLIFGGNLYVSANSELLIEFDVPEYTITESGNYDYIDIPGGGILLEEEGRPRIPYYIYSVDYAQSYRIQDVLMRERSEPEVNSGLNLPVIIQQWTITKSIELKAGRYPEIDFEWETVRNADGSVTLDIIVYPVKYNPQTKELLFYRHYSFVVDYILSEIEFVSVNTDKPSYQCGETVEINTEISNTGIAQDLYLDIVIRLYGSGNYVDSFAIRQLKDVIGNCSVNAQWDSSGIEAGNYYAEVALTDVNGNIIAAKNTGFALNEISSATTTQTDSTSTTGGNALFDRLKDYIIWIIGIVIAVAVIVIIIIILNRKSRR